MTQKERLAIFLQSLETDKPDYLTQMELEARSRDVPLIREDTQGFLRTLLALLRPKRVLEIGTAEGFSAALMLTYGPKEMSLVSIEKDLSRWQIARKNQQRLLDEGVIRPGQLKLLQGEADDLLPTLTGSYDLVFMDAAKGQYLHWLPDVLIRMHSGSVLVSDNCLFDGEIIQPRSLVRRRDRTIHARMRDYLFALTHTSCLRTSILPVGDGIALSVMKEETASVLEREAQ